MTEENITAQRLKSFIERIERLQEERSGLSVDIKDIYDEAKGTGFDVPTIRKIVALRKKDAQQRREEQELLELYKTQLGLE